MNLEPQPLEQQFRIARLKNHLKELEREELEEFAGRLLEVSAKLAHQSKQMLAELVRVKSD